MSLPANRTKLAQAQANQVAGNTADASANINAMVEAYDTIDQLNQKVDALVSASILTAYPPSFISRQAIINGNFDINQRVVSGTVTLTAGKYGHDRWKAGASGCTYTFATASGVTTITITAGSLVQVIEGATLPSGTYCLSWAGTAQGRINGGGYGTSGGTASITGGNNVTVEFSAGTISKVQFSAGSVILPFQPRSFAEELALCQRYFQIIKAPNLRIPLASSVTATDVIIPLKLSGSMRINPTTSITGVRGTDWILTSIAGANNTTGTLTQFNYGTDYGLIYFSSGSFTAGTPMTIVLPSGDIRFDAEL